MADLQLEQSNTAGKTTQLIGLSGPEDFIGSSILDVIPEERGVFKKIDGISGHGANKGTGVRGISTSGFGVSGEGLYGVVGDGLGQNGAGVMGRHTDGMGVFGDGTPGVLGRCSAHPAQRPLDDKLGPFAGVNGQSDIGPGVYGEGEYGAEFKGKSAQLRLFPGSGVGKPTSGTHFVGELYMDSKATLFICIADGTPGTWVQIVTA